MSDSPTPLTITIVTLNRREILEKTLWYLYETTTDAERDIWIWDNGSQDDTPAFLGTMVGWPGVRVFRSTKDLGTAGPRKKMLRHIQSPYVMTLDDDVWMVTKGWATAVVKVLESDPTICQLGIPQGYVHSTSNYGIAHTRLAIDGDISRPENRPFFRVPPVLPQPVRRIPDDAPMLKNHTVGVPGSGPAPAIEMCVVEVAGERIGVPPVQGQTQLSVAVTGGCSVWRMSDVLQVLDHQERHPVVDLREAWSFPLQASGLREGLILEYGCLHPSPGPLWHLGHSERYWENRCDMAEAIYGRSAETQRGWLETARQACGWGRPLDDPDDVLK